MPAHAHFSVKSMNQLRKLNERGFVHQPSATRSTRKLWLSFHNLVPWRGVGRNRLPISVANADQDFHAGEIREGHL
jgi:hypothetical protein